MVTLQDAGKGVKNEDIQRSIREYLVDVKIPIDKTDDYIKYKNIVFKENTNATDTGYIKVSLVKGRSVLTKVYADIIKVPKKGKSKVLATNVKIASFPQLISNRGSYIVNGAEYNLINQLRRNAAPYITFDDKTQTAFGEFNLAKGRNFKLVVDNKTNKISTVFGTTNIPVKVTAELLKLTKDEFEEALGETFTVANWDNVSDHQVEL